MQHLSEDPSLQLQYSISVQNRFHSLQLSDDVENTWNTIKSIITEATTVVVGFRKSIKKPWMSAETYETVRKKSTSRLQGNNAKRKRL